MSMSRECQTTKGKREERLEKLKETIDKLPLTVMQKEKFYNEVRFLNIRICNMNPVDYLDIERQFAKLESDLKAQVSENNEIANNPSSFFTRSKCNLEHYRLDKNTDRKLTFASH